MFGPEKIWAEKNFGQKIFLIHKNFSQKKEFLLLRKNFRMEKCF